MYPKMPRPKTRRSRKRKGSALKQTPEVFVLSPQLLHKLGINIANIQTPSASSSISVSAQDDLFKKPMSTRKSKTIEESSVMTTANLMKESVLLSPSFISPVEYQEGIENIPVSSPNVELPAIDHVGNSPECSNISPKNDYVILNSDNSALAEPTVAMSDNISKKNDINAILLSQQPTLIPSKMYTSYNLDQSCSDLQYHIQTYIAESVHFNLQKDLPMCNKKKNTIQDEDKSLITLNDLNIDDDHLDEAYSSDCSNGNNTLSAVSAEFNLDPPQVGNVRGQKINILSEEVIDNSRLNEMISKSLSPSVKDKMIPVSVDTIMSFNRNVTKANNCSEPRKYKSNSEPNSQDQLLSANVSMEQVSTADESFLDNIITGVMKIDEIDINILDVSDADLNTHNISNSVCVNVPEASESNTLDYTSDIAIGPDQNHHSKLNLDCTTNNLQCDNNSQIANVQDISKVIETNPNIFIEFIDKYPEATGSSLNNINRNEHDCAILSQIESDIKTMHNTLLRKPIPTIEDSINQNEQNKMSTLENADKNIVENIVIEKKETHKQEILLDGANESGVAVNDEILETPTESKIEMHTHSICLCKCNVDNVNATHQGQSDPTNNGNNEKLNEIASYLKMFVENKRRKSETIYSKTRPPHFAPEAVLKPKSCVHGVEKPGGSNKDRTQYEDDFKITREAKQVPKIYKRNKNKLTPSKANVTTSNIINTHEKDINISDCIISEKATDYFCLCSDYGTFDFNDFEGYSHIHYWDNISIDVDVSGWFSEFNYIDYVEKNLNKEELLPEITESREIILDPICWVGWDHSEKIIPKNLCCGNSVKDLVHNMPNVTIVDFPDNSLESTQRNNSNNMCMENSMSQTKMDSQDIEPETDSINPPAPQVAADDPNNECEVIYQVIQCLDEFETVQVASSDSRISKGQVSNAHSDVDVLVNKNKKGDDNSVGSFLTKSTRQTKRQPNNDINEKSTRLEEKASNTILKKVKQSLNTSDKVSTDKSCSDVNIKINVDEKNTRKTDKEESIELNAEPSSMINKRTYEKSHDTEIGLQEHKSFKICNRKRSSNINIELLDDKSAVSKISKRQASEYIKPEFMSNISTTFDKRTCTKEHDLKTNKSANRRQSRNANKIIKPEMDAKELNSLMEAGKVTDTDDLEVKTDDLTTKMLFCNARKETKSEVNANKLNNYNDKDKIDNRVTEHDLSTNESTTRRKSRNARKDTNSEVDAEDLNSLNKTDKIISTDSTYDLKTFESTTKRQSRTAIKVTKPEQNAEELNSIDESKKIANTDDPHGLRSNVSATNRQSRTTKKDIKLDIGAEDLNKLKKTNKITIKEAVNDPKPNESTTTRRSRCDKKDNDSELDAEMTERFNKIDNIMSTDVVRELKPKESTTTRKSRNARKDVNLDVDAEELNSFNKTNDKTSNDIKSSDVTRRRSCRISSEKLNTKLSETKLIKTETPPPKLRSKRSKTSEDNRSQNYLQVQKSVHTYESKKEREKKANYTVKPGLAVEPTPSSSGSKEGVSDTEITSNTNISTPSKVILGYDHQQPTLSIEKPTKFAIKPKRSAIKSIDSDSTNAEVSLLKTEETHPDSASQLDLTIEPATSDSAVRISYTTECGVCDAQVEEWIDHIAAKHNYLAWKKGDLVLDLNNPNAIKSHLKSILSKTKILTCSRCDCKLKNPKTFIEHIKNCDKSDDEDTALSTLQSKKAKRGEIVADTKTCGMCSVSVGLKDWESHVMFTHYNLAWAVGDTPPNLKDPNLICRQLKVYKSAGGQFKCNLCGLTRSSALGFYAHVVGCGKSAEEMEEHMETCDQCHKSYLCVNRQPHRAWHTQMEIKKEAKMKAMVEQAQIVEKVEEEPEVGRKRKAARKAISMMHKLKSSKDDILTCERCDYTGTTSEQLKSHKCVDAGMFTDHGDESEDSLEFASDQSDDEVSDGEQSHVEHSDDADDENDNKRRMKRKSEHVSKYERIPFEISSEAATSYVEHASKLFIAQYFSDDTLFENWRNAEYTVLNEKEIATYTPPVAESCKFATAHKWTSLKRFESVKLPAIALFVGGCPASMCWVPARLSTNDSEQNYLAVATHLGPDPPRYSSHKRYSSPGTVLQIWDFGYKPYASNPKLSMCIAMDKGTVWSMSWCPSGARDSASSKDARLLGLVAVACSDGTAYVYSVPHPALFSDEKEPVFVKLKPVAELRLYYDPEKQICQSSKIFWSMQKGHEVVAVGYSNGMIAFFDLCTESPITRRCEGDCHIFYPFFSQQAHWSCITGVSMYPMRGRGSGLGTWTAGAAAGGVLGGAGTARLLPAAAADAAFLPLWPAALLLNDDSCTNEMDFSGVVRKYSGAAAAAGCLHCSRLAQFSSPLLKTMVSHPVFKDMKKRPQVLIQMRRLNREPKDETPDGSKGKERSVNLDPFTYEQAIEEYGVRLKFCKKTDRLSYDKEFNPGLFPLSEVTAMAFCPTPTNHQWLAVATHSGLVFFIKTS